MIGIEAPRGTATVAGAPGSGVLEVVRRGRQSIVTRAMATSPLRLLTPRNHGGGAWIYAGTYGGGLVDGDALRLEVSVGPHAAAMLSTQASTKVYRSRGTTVDLDAVVASGGLLAVLPDPVICFAASSCRQTQRVKLNAGASLILVDWLTSGRHAAGERWRFDRYASRIEVQDGSRLVMMDSLSLDAAEGNLDARMGRFNVLCLIALVGPSVREHAERVLSQVASVPVVRRARLLAGASAVADGGCLVKIAGVSLEEVASAARDYLRFVPSLLGDDPWARKW